MADNPKFKSMDRAIEKEGFKLMLLLRLSPLFPFALSNYLYGASSIRFLPYFFGTLLGFGKFVSYLVLDVFMCASSSFCTCHLQLQEPSHMSMQEGLERL